MSNRLVFRIDLSGAIHVIAAPSRRHAAMVLGISPHLLKKHGAEVNYGGDYEQAMSEPGAVFMRPHEDGEWVRKQSSKKSMSLPTRGGYRPGGGGHLLGESVAKQMPIRLSDAHHADYLSLGGTQWMRSLLAEQDVPSEDLLTLEREEQPKRVRSIRLSDEDRERYKQRGGAEWLRRRIDHAMATQALPGTGSVEQSRGRKPAQRVASKTPAMKLQPGHSHSREVEAISMAMGAAA